MENLDFLIIPMFIFIRMSTFFISMNFMYPSGTPNSVKVFLPLLITGIISFSGGSTIKVVGEVDHIITLLVYTFSEIITGLMLGYILSICLNIVKMSGSLIDMQMGLSMASIYDSNSNKQTTVIENLVYWTTLLIFLSFDGHHLLINGIIKSFKLVPIGTSILSDETTLAYIVNVFIEYFGLGFKIALPILLSLLLTELILGLISRSVPSFNVMLIGMPVKVLVGLALILIALPYLFSELVDIVNTMPSVLENILTIKR